jgi:hypothetical protein
VNRLMYGERDEPWRAMHRLGEVLVWAAEPDRAFPCDRRHGRDALRLPFVALALVDVDGSERVVAERGEQRGATIEVPLVHGTERVGRLVLGVRPGENGFRGDELRLLEDLARQAGTAINAIRLRDDLARSRERLVVAARKSAVGSGGTCTMASGRRWPRSACAPKPRPRRSRPTRRARGSSSTNLVATSAWR